jgi:hypothetical protein
MTPTPKKSSFLRKREIQYATAAAMTARPLEYWIIRFRG